MYMCILCVRDCPEIDTTPCDGNVLKVTEPALMFSSGASSYSTFMVLFIRAMSLVPVFGVWIATVTVGLMGSR